MAFGLLDPVRAGRMLPELGSSKITADWGTRMLAWDHPLYESQHYNNGTVWGFVTGFVALAHYRYHRAWAGFDLVRDVARTSFDFARGRNPELMSGAFYRTLDTAVPQQFFATSMLVSPLVRGLLGWEPDAPRGRATLAPHLPAEWDSLAVLNLAVGASKLRVAVAKEPGVYRLRVGREGGGGGPLALRVAPALPLGAAVEAVTVNGTGIPFTVEESPHDVHAITEVALQAEAVVEIRHRGGLEVVTPAERLAVGDPSGSLRVLDLRREGAEYVIAVEGLAGRAYTLDLRPGREAAVGAVSNADRVAGPEGLVRLRVAFPAGVAGFMRREIRVRG